MAAWQSSRSTTRVVLGRSFALRPHLAEGLPFQKTSRSIRRQADKVNSFTNAFLRFFTRSISPLPWQIRVNGPEASSSPCLPKLFEGRPGPRGIRHLICLSQGATFKRYIGTTEPNITQLPPTLAFWGTTGELKRSANQTHGPATGARG